MVAGAFAVSRLEGGLLGPLEGFLIHWVGPRPYMMVGAVIFGLGLISIGLAQSIPLFYGAFLLTTLGQTMAGFLPILTVLINWFQRWRGRAIGVYQLGSSFGALLVPLVAWFILNVGWRQSVIAMGIFSIVVGLAVASVMRIRPEDYGYLPDGDEPVSEALGEAIAHAGEPGESAPRAESQSTILQVLRGRNFWLLALAHSLSLTVWGSLRVHEIPALVDLGFTEQAAANILSVSLIVAGGGRLFGGFLGDTLGTRNILVAAFLVQAASMLILAYASTLLQAMIFAVLFGVAFGARGTLLTVLRGDLFGRTNFSRLSGLMDAVTTLGVVVSPIFTGYVYDLTGSYRLAFLVIAMISGAAALLLFGVRYPDSRRRDGPVTRVTQEMNDMPAADQVTNQPDAPTTGQNN